MIVLEKVECVGKSVIVLAVIMKTNIKIRYKKPNSLSPKEINLLFKRKLLMKNIQKDVIVKNLDVKKNIVNVIKPILNVIKAVDVKDVWIAIPLM